LASFSSLGNLLTVKAIVLGNIKEILTCEHWESVARIQEILSLWISFASSTLQRRQESESATPTKAPARILYETLFYRRFGATQAEQGWPYHEFPEKLFSLRLDRWDLQDVHVKLIVMLKDVVRPDHALFSLPVETDGQETIGFCSARARAGDVVAIVMDCRFPVVLRPRDGNYELVNEAYVYGHMNGDLIHNMPEVDVVLMRL
jgi:hypothetical protein